MKQSFKIGKIFLFIIVSVCVFFNYEIGLCNGGGSSSQKDTPKGGVISPSFKNFNTPSFPENAGESVECKLAEHDETIKKLEEKLKQQTGEIVKLRTEVNDRQIKGVVNQQVSEITKLKSELKQQIRDVAKFKTEVNNQHVAINQQVENVVNQQINETAKLKSELERQTDEIAQLKAEIDDQQVKNIANQQASEMIKLKNELEQQVKEVAKLKNEINNQQVAMNQQAENVVNQQNDLATKLQAELNAKLAATQQQLEDMQLQLDEITNSQSEVTVAPKMVQTKTAVIEYLPIDISGGIFDSTFVAMKNVDDFNMESEHLNFKVGFNYNIYLKKNEGDDFNKYIILNPKFFGVDNVYFSIFNYHNFLKNKHTNSEDFKKNYYTLYAKSNIDEINSVYFGGSVGYIPFKSAIDDSDKNFKKYMLFVSLNTDFDLMLFNNSLHFSNLLTLDFNLLRSNYLVNSNKSNEYIKIKEGILLNYEVDGLTDLFAGVDFSVYTMHRQFRKDIGLNKNTECNLVAGIKFEFGSINISLGNRGIGLGLSMNY